MDAPNRDQAFSIMCELLNEGRPVHSEQRIHRDGGEPLFETLMKTIEARFARPESRRQVRDFKAGLLAPLPFNNCWTIADTSATTARVACRT